MVASWIVRSTLERAVQVQALAGDIVLCSWARRFTPGKLLGTLQIAGDLQWTSIPSRGGKNTSSQFMGLALAAVLSP